MPQAKKKKEEGILDGDEDARDCVKSHCHCFLVNPHPLRRSFPFFDEGRTQAKASTCAIYLSLLSSASTQAHYRTMLANEFIKVAVRRLGSKFELLLFVSHNTDNFSHLPP